MANKVRIRTSEAYIAAGWLTDLWHPPIPGAGEAQHERESARVSYKIALAQFRSDDLDRFYRKFQALVNEILSAARVPCPNVAAELLGALADVPLGFALKGHRWVPELSIHTLRFSGLLATRARKVRARIIAARDSCSEFLKALPPDDERVITMTDDVQLDRDMWRSMLVNLERLEVMASEGVGTLEKLRRAARVSDRAGAVRRTNRVAFLGAAAAELARRIARLSPDKAPKAVHIDAAELMNLIYDPILDRPLTAEDINSRLDAQERKKTKGQKIR